MAVQTRRSSWTHLNSRSCNAGPTNKAMSSSNYNTAFAGNRLCLNRVQVGNICYYVTSYKRDCLVTVSPTGRLGSRSDSTFGGVGS